MLPFSQCLDVVAHYTNIFESGTSIFLFRPIFVFPKIFDFVVRLCTLI